MSETINIENSIYDFEIVLLVVDNKATGANKYKPYPINKSSVKYLEITNDLANIGYTGTIIFSNFFNILQKLNAFNAYSEAPYLYINFKNKDFENAGVAGVPLYLFGSLGKTSETSSNIIDKHITFKFEEYLISHLKRASMINYFSNNASSSLGTSDSVTPDANTDTPANLIKKLLLYGSKQAGATVSATISGSPLDEPILLAHGGDITNESSLYNGIQYLTKYLSFKPNETLPQELSDFYSPGIVQLENTPDNKKRQFVISSLSSNIQKFLSIIKNNKTSAETKNYLTEKFVISMSNDISTYRDNFISKYNLMRVDYHDVYEKKWCGVEYTTGDLSKDITCSVNTKAEYGELRTAFERIFTAPYATNIPDRSREDPNNIKTIKYAIPNISEKLAKVYGTNAVFKSFIFDNIALTFRVKGQPYRIPGKFIQIEADSSSTKSTSNTSIDSDELNGYWYIISVKHIFENDIYYNDYVCVKIYSNKGELSTVSSTTIPGSSPGGSGTSAPTSNAVIGPDGSWVEPPLPTPGSDTSTGLLPPLPGVSPLDIEYNNPYGPYTNEDNPFSWKKLPNFLTGQ